MMGGIRRAHWARFGHRRARQEGQCIRPPNQSHIDARKLREEAKCLEVIPRPEKQLPNNLGDYLPSKARPVGGERR